MVQWSIAFVSQPFQRQVLTFDSNVAIYGIANSNFCPNGIYSKTCIQRPHKRSNESGLLQQVVFKCRFH